MEKSRKIVVLAVAMIFALLGTLSAQTTRGSIAGVVTDNSGAVVTGAKVTATPTTGGEPRTTTTGPNGEYRIEALNPAPYTVLVDASGFASTKIENVMVRTSQITSNNIQLKVAQTSENVTVEATPDSIQTDTGELSKTIPVQQVKDLPYSSLNPYSLATTLPGVATVQSRDDFTNGASFSVNGLRPRSNNFLLDGFDNNDNSIAGQAFQPGNTESIQEVTVLTNSYAAEYGRGGGSVSNVTFRSGSNNFHGAAWEQYSGSALNAIPAEDSRNLGMQREDCTAAQLAAGPCVRGPSQFVNNVYGFRFGGPIVKNKLFFFGTAQWNHFYGAQSVPTLFLPTAAGLQTLQTVAANNPATAPQINLLLQSLNGVVGNAGSSAFPVSLGTRNGCVGTCDVEFGAFSRTDKGASLSREWTTRVDYAGQNDSIYVRYTDSMGSLTPDLFANSFSIPTTDTQQGGPSRLFGTMWAHTFNPNVINEFRASAQQINFTFGPTAATAASPLANLPTFTLTDNLTPNFAGFGGGTFPQGRGHKTYQFQDAVSWNKGTHNMKLGADLSVLLINDLIPFNSNGFITVSGGGDCTALGLPGTDGCTDLGNYIDNVIGPGGSISKQFGNPRLNIPTTQQAYYFEDSWKVRSNLSLDYGLRYEYQPPDASNGLPFPSVDAATFTTDPFQTRREVQPDRNNFAPRFGFAYTPNVFKSIFGENKTVVRGGFGVFYDTFFTNISDNTAASSPNTLGGTLTGTADAANPRGAANPLALVATIAPQADPTNTITAVTSNLVQPMTYQWNLNLQRELPGKTTMEVAYVGTRGEHLFVNQQLNPRIASGTATSGARLDPTFGSIVVRSNGGDSIYHGLQTTVTRNVGNLSLRGSYTFSKSIDNGSEVFVTSGGATRWENVFDPRSDRGPSAFDRRHRAAISYVYQLPFKPHNSFLNYVVGGWATSGLISFQSGAPDTIFLSGRDVNGDGETANDRPVLGNPNAALNYSSDCRAVGSGCNTGVGVVSRTGTVTALFSGAPVTADQVKYLIFPTNSGVQGNVGRNSFYWPGRQDWNLSMFKRIPMPYNEHHQVELRADLFNAFNHPNAGVSGLQANLLNANFQNIDNTMRGGRSVVLWLKYQF